MLGLLQFPCKILFSTTKWPDENLFPPEIFHDDQWLYNDATKTSCLYTEEEKGLLCFHRGSTTQDYRSYGLK